jgi:Protein of unknown function (DUF3667)
VTARRVTEALRAPVAATWAASLPQPDAAASAEAALCPGCGRPVADEYCGACGEPRRVEPLSLGNLIAAGVEHLTSFDVRLLRTLRLLLTRPGQLTVEYRRGVRVRYTRPLQLFLLVVGAAFLAVSVIGSKTLTQADFLDTPGLAALAPRIERMERESHETPAQFYARFGQRSDDVKRVLLLAFVPVLALCLLVLYAGSGRYAVEHFVFATHYMSFLVVFFIAWKSFAKGSRLLVDGYFRTHGGTTPSWASTSMIVVVFLVAVVTAGHYLWAAIRRAYDDSGGDALARTGMLVLVIIVIAGAYRTLDYRATLLLM